MTIDIVVGDVLEVPADILISTANPWLNMSGGVNGAILAKGGDSIQAELHAHVTSTGSKSVQPGTVVRTSPGPLPFRHILHAVAIDPFYDSDVPLVRRTLQSAFRIAQGLGAQSLSMPMLATGYGHLTTEQFAEAFAFAVQEDWSPLRQVHVVFRSEEDAAIVRSALASTGASHAEDLGQPHV
jgi:O-acetyl-ADP-ribose deacetylase (regulator of RNase III)